MALVPCSECGNAVAYSAPACPGCGNIDPSGRVKKSKLHAKLLGLTIIIVAGCVLWFVVPSLEPSALFHQLGQPR